MPGLKYPLKLGSLPHAALAPQPCPTRSLPDYDTLYKRMVDNGGWFVLRTDPSEDRPTTSGSTEAPLVKMVNSHFRTVRKQALHIRRLALDAWYIELGKKGETDVE
jgi:hypothetical protein